MTLLGVPYWLRLYPHTRTGLCQRGKVPLGIGGFFMPKIACTIAGSDSSGGAGIQTDLKTFAALGVYGASVITAVTAQNTLGVSDIEPLSTKNISMQMDAVFSDLEVNAVKVGMLFSQEIIEVVTQKLKQ